MIVVNDKFKKRKPVPLRVFVKKFKIEKAVILDKTKEKPKKQTIHVGHIYVRNVFTNYFLTLTDLNNKVILSLSTGQVSQGKNQKKRKLSYDNILRLIHKLILKLNALNIQGVYIIQRSSKN